MGRAKDVKCRQQPCETEALCYGEFVVVESCSASCWSHARMMLRSCVVKRNAPGARGRENDFSSSILPRAANIAGDVVKMWTIKTRMSHVVAWEASQDRRQDGSRKDRKILMVKRQVGVKINLTLGCRVTEKLFCFLS